MLLNGTSCLGFGSLGELPIALCSLGGELLHVEGNLGHSHVLQTELACDATLEGCQLPGETCHVRYRVAVLVPKLAEKLLPGKVVRSKHASEVGHQAHTQLELGYVNFAAPLELDKLNSVGCKPGGGAGGCYIPAIMTSAWKSPTHPCTGAKLLPFADSVS